MAVLHQKPERVWEHAGRCGCGECRFHPRRECPMADSRKAIWLWSSLPRDAVPGYRLRLVTDTQRVYTKG